MSRNLHDQYDYKRYIYYSGMKLLEYFVIIIFLIFHCTCLIFLF